jgi:hypothetical protein
MFADSEPRGYEYCGLRGKWEMAEVKSDKGDQREKQRHREGSSFFRMLRASLNQSKFCSAESGC